jgi:nitrite reductase (NADH) large subunit
MNRHVIVGLGIAGISAARKIREVDKEGAIDIFTKEAYPFYYRPRLPDYVAGEVEVKGFIVNPASWYEKERITLHLEEGVSRVDPDKHEVETVKGETFAYDRLLLATGGNSFVPPIKGSDKEGVFALRNVADADRIKAYAAKSKKLILIGGGLLGLEAGNGLRKAGLKVAVMERSLRLLPRQTDPACSEILKAKMEEMGFTIMLEARSAEILGDKKVEGLRLESGETVSGDMILISAGVRPELGLAQAIGLEIDKAVVVNDRMETSRESVYAAGDVIQHRGHFYGIWPASQAQGEVAGVNMAGGEGRYEGTVMSNRLKVMGIDLVASGEIDPEGQLECEKVVEKDKGIYRKLVLKEGRTIGCVLFGDVSGSQQLLNAIERGVDVSHCREGILKKDFDFGQLNQ